MTDRRIEKRNHPDGQKKRDEMRVIHSFVMSSGVETPVIVDQKMKIDSFASRSLGLPVYVAVSRAAPFLDFARNDNHRM
jgi:hypothetical protein